MGMQFLIRKIQKDNPFQRAICQLMETEGDELYISSGYVSRSILLDKGGKRIKFKDNQNKEYSFLDSIDKGFKGSSNHSIIVIGGMFKSYDQGTGKEVPDTYQRGKFNIFLKDLEAQIGGSVPLKFYQANNERWHSKIALKVNKGEPVAAIIGSSNLSTFSFGTWSGYNHEADIYLYKGRKGIRDIQYDISFLKNQRKALIDEFIHIIKSKKISLNEKELRDGLYSQDIEITKNIAERVYNQEKLEPEYNNLQYLLYTVKQYNLLISSTDNHKVSSKSVITVTPTSINVNQILYDIYNDLQNGIASYTTLKNPNTSGDYL